MGLTPDGAAFCPMLDSSWSRRRGLPGRPRSFAVRGRLRLGFVDSTAFEFVPWFLRRFRSAWPEADVELHTMSSDEQARALVDGDIDLGVARTVPVRPAVDSAVLGHDRFMLAVPADHAAAGQRTVRCGGSCGRRSWGSRNEFTSLHAELRSLLEATASGTTRRSKQPSTPRSSVCGSRGGVALCSAGVRRLQLPNVAYVKVADADARVALVRLSRIDEPQTIVANAITELTRTAAQ